MKIEQKLNELWCPRHIEGKTISKFHYDRHDPIVVFTDGTYFCRQDPQELMEAYQFERGEDAPDHPLVIIGILSEHEVDKYWKESDAQYEMSLKENRRKQYDKLREEFENEN